MVILVIVMLLLFVILVEGLLVYVLFVCWNELVVWGWIVLEVLGVIWFFVYVCVLSLCLVIVGG